MNSKYHLALFLLITFTGFTKCQSPDHQIKEAFDTVNNSLSQSNDFLVDPLGFLHRSIDSTRSANPEYAGKADSIYSSVTNAYKYLGELKYRLKEMDSTGLKTEIALKLLHQPSISDSLTLQLLRVYQNCNGIQYSTREKSALDTALQYVEVIQQKANWKKIYFENTPTIAASTILTKLQNDCQHAGIIALQTIKNHLVQ